MAKKKIAQLNADTLFEFGKAEKIQQFQLFDVQGEVQEIKEGLDLLEKMQTEIYADGQELISELENLLNKIESRDLSDNTLKSIEGCFDDYLKSIQDLSPSADYDIRKTKEVITNNDWEYYFDRVTKYAKEVGYDDNEDPFLSLLGEQEYKKLEEEIDGEFSKRTSIKNKTDLKFLAIAIALEVTKGLIFPIIADKMGYGDSFNPEDRLAHNDKSIEKKHKEANDEYRDKKLEKNSAGKWIEFLYQTVPYDITAGTGNMQDINLHGGSHRLYTLGHDPILGWIFGTANILTDVITISPGAVVQNNNKWAEVIKIAGIR